MIALWRSTLLFSLEDGGKDTGGPPVPRRERNRGDFDGKKRNPKNTLSMVYKRHLGRLVMSVKFYFLLLKSD